MPAETQPPLRDRLQADARTALREGDKLRLSVLRMALAAVQQREVDSRETLDEEGIRKVLEKMVKQRRESVEQFRKGGRADLVARESAEIAVLEAYLPEPMSEADMAALVEEVVTGVGAASVKDMGRVMGEIKRRGGGAVDLGRVSALVRSRLQPP